MFINSVSSATVANSVWTTLSRTLTSLAPNALTNTLLFNQSIAAGATVQLTATAAGFSLGWLIVNSGAAGTTTIGIFDGFSNNPGVSIAASGKNDRFLDFNAGAGVIYVQNNDVVNSAFYTLTQQQLQ